MLITNKTRSITAHFYANNSGVKELVKTTTINFNKDAIPSIVEQIVNNELYAANRSEMRKDEEELSKLRYNIEDEILAENETEVPTEVQKNE